MQDDAPSRTGTERILDAAVRLLGQNGIAATSLKVIAAEAGVSQALIIHHFGSKVGLRKACDAHVNQLLRARKETVIEEGPHLDPLHGLRMMDDGRDLMRYLVRTLTEGGDGVDALIDEMVADAEEYTARGVETGTFRASVAPRERVVLLTLWSLGTLVLHEHLDRLLGVDLLAEDYGPAGLGPYIRPTMELLTQGLFEDGAYEQFIRAFDVSDRTADVPDTTADTPESATPESDTPDSGSSPSGAHQKD